MLDKNEGERLIGDEIATQALLGALILQMSRLTSNPVAEMETIRHAAISQITALQLYGIEPYEAEPAKRFAQAFVANVFRALDAP